MGAIKKETVKEHHFCVHCTNTVIYYSTTPVEPESVLCLKCAYNYD